MHFVSGSVILLPGCWFVSHNILHAIPFHSHSDSQMTRAEKCLFGALGADLSGLSLSSGPMYE